MKKRVLCILLAALTLASCLVFASCGKTPTGETGTTAASATTTAAAGEEKLVFTGEKYQGTGSDDVFRIYMRESTFYTSLYIYVEEDEGDVMSASTFKRNSQLQKDLNIKLEARTAESPENDVEKNIQSGDVDYDVILSRTANQTSKIQNGVFAQWNDTGIDFTNVWWDKNCLDGYSIEGKTYMMACDVSVSRINNAQFLYFNKALIEDYKLQDKDPYKLVESNDWTLDNFLTLVRSVSNVKDDDLGTYGWMFAPGAANGSNMHILSGCGINYTNLLADGSRTVAIGDQLEKIDDIWGKIYSVASDKQYALSGTEASEMLPAPYDSDKNRNTRQMFAHDHFLFLQGGMIISQELVDMEHDYGIAPNPKYDKNQDTYYHRIDKYSIIFTIPKCANVDKERTAKIMDYWAYLSHDTVMPSYYEVTIKARRFKDPTAVKMVDLVKDTILYEVADVFSTGISDALNTGYTNQTTAATWQSNAGVVDQKFGSIVNKIKALDG